MLGMLRSFAKSWVAGVLFAGLIVVFLFSHSEDALRPRSGNALAKVGAESIQPLEFRQQFDRWLENVRAQDPSVTKEEAIARGVPREILNTMLDARSMDIATRKLGLRVSDKQLAGEVFKFPAFIDEVTGKFDQTKFLQALQGAKYTEEQFYDEMRGDMLRSQLGAAVISGARTPKSLVNVILAFQSEKRTFATVLVPKSAIPAPKEPTDVEVKAFYDGAAAANLRVPELRGFTVAALKPEDFLSKVNISEAEIDADFAAIKNRLGTPEKRSALTLPVKDQATADKILALLKTGISLEAAAASLKLDAPVPVASQSRDSIANKAVADAIFAQPLNGMTVAKTKLGFSVVVVTAITPGIAPDLVAERTKLATEKRLEAAKELMFKAVEDFETLMAEGNTVDQAASKLGIKSLSLAPVSAQGLDQNGQPVLAIMPYAKLLKAGFELGAGDVSNIEPLPNDGGFALIRVDRVVPESKVPLEKVRSALVAELKATASRKALEARADEIIAKSKAGGGLLKTAPSFGLKASERPLPLRRGQTDAVMNADIARIGFGAKLGSIVAAPSPDGVVLVEVLTITRDDPKTLADQAEGLKAALDPQAGETLAGVYQSALKIRLRPSINDAKLDAEMRPSEGQ